MSIRCETPCDYGTCPYDAQYSHDCEYWCGAEEPADDYEEREEDSTAPYPYYYPGDMIHGDAPGIVHWEYYNPDGGEAEKGQLVQNCIYTDLFEKVLLPWAKAGYPPLSDMEQVGMWDRLGSECVQYCYDIGVDYEDEAECLSDLARGDNLIGTKCNEAALRAIAEFFLKED